MNNIIIVVGLFVSQILFSSPHSTIDEQNTIREHLFFYQIFNNLIGSEKNIINNSFYHAQLNDCLLNNTTWKKNDLGSSIIIGGDYSKSYFFSDNFSKASIEKADFTEASFIGIRGHKVYMEKISIKNSFFTKVIIRRTDMRGSRIKEVNFSGSNFSNVNLHDASLENVSFANSILHKINFDGAIFKNIQLENAQLSNFSIKGAKIYDEKMQAYRKLKVTDLIAAGAIISMRDRLFNIF